MKGSLMHVFDFPHPNPRQLLSVLLYLPEGEGIFRGALK
jgi:hypothetical protein